MPIPIKEQWSTKPFVRLLIPFVLGNMICFYLPISLFQIRVVAITGLTFCLSFYLLNLTQKYIFGWVSGIGINLLFLALGACITYAYHPINHSNWIGHSIQKKQQHLIICVFEPPIKKTKAWRAIANVEAINLNVVEQKQIADWNNQSLIWNIQTSTLDKKAPVWVSVKGKIFLYIKHKKLADALKIGSRIVVKGPLQKIQNNQKLGSFNYQQWAALQQIHFQVYLADSNCLKLSSTELPFSSLVYSTKNKVLAILRKYIPDKKVVGVAEALLIGYKEDLDKQLLQAYSNTGVVHIIAISGMHLGMIYGLMLFLFQLFTPNKWINYLKPIIILLVLWGFAFLTGGAASILRSAVTFSFLLFSERWGYKNNTINALAASAFFLLIYNPYLLWDIGFQLSYAAVLGIVLYGKPINNWFTIENPILRYLWQINAITLSAQIFTIPLVLFYFHQFPNFFLFTNFLIVPLSGIILYTELLLLIPIPFIQWPTGKLLSHFISGMNGIIERTNNIPYVVTGNLYPSLLQTMLFFLAIVAFLHWLRFKKNAAFILGFGLLASILFLQRMEFLLEKSLLKPTFAPPFKATKQYNHAKKNTIRTHFRFL